MKLFITSTGTNIGKTLITCKLANQFKKQDLRVLKPVISGWNEQYNDVYEILNSLNIPHTQNNIDAVSLYRFKKPISVDLAAKFENIIIKFDKIVSFCNTKSDITVIEGAGGIMSPISDGYTNLDLIKATNSSIILVIGNYLGTISHTLCALEVIKYYNINLLKIFLTHSADSNCSLEDNISILKQFTSVEILKINKINTKDNKWLYIDNINL